MSLATRALYSATTTHFFNNKNVQRPDPIPEKSRVRVKFRILRARASKSEDKRFSVCTADELHFVSVPNSDWSLALWRYRPPPEAKKRNHPLLLLSGIATNAIGYDLSPECSFARYMSRNGFDTWTLELRGSGLSTLGLDFNKHPLNLSNNANSSVDDGKDGKFPSTMYNSLNIHAFPDSDISSMKKNGTHMVWDKPQSMTNSSETFMPEGISSLLREGYLQGQDSVSGMSQWLEEIVKGSQRLVPTQFLGMQKGLSSTFEDFRQQFELIFKYDWDFDTFLEEDLPAAMEYIRSQCKPDDGKLHAIGHSMGGILLYSRVSQCCAKGRDSGLSSITTLASSLDYSTSRSSLKLLLPLADPAQALNVPAIPVGALLAAIHPLISYPPYLFSWLKGQVSAQEMMQPELYEKLMMNNFCTIPAKLLLQLASAFYKRGLSNRDGSFFYKDHLRKTNVPILAIGGDQDRICPPEAVYEETTKLIPEHMVTLKILGEPGGPHYAHYDVVGSHLAEEQVYPHIIKFLDNHDS